MVINGVDYSLPLIAILSFLTLFGVQLLLLRVRIRFLRHLCAGHWAGTLGIYVEKTLKIGPFGPIFYHLYWSISLLQKKLRPKLTSSLRGRRPWQSPGTAFLAIECGRRLPRRFAPRNDSGNFRLVLLLEQSNHLTVLFR